MHIKSILISLFFVIVFGANAKASISLSPETNVEEVETHIKTMSLEQKVGQLFIFGYSGTQFSPRLKKMLSDFSPGALISFGRNIKNPYQVNQFNFHAQQHSLKVNSLPLFMMVDQEGGTVTRIRTDPLPPSALSLGRTGNKSLVRETGFITGQILKLLGFNINLAPVVDLSNPDVKNFIGNRSFGNDPKQVTLMSEAFAMGLVQSNVLPTLKHFPGHGGDILDSHKALPKKMLSVEDAAKHDLKPFMYFSKNQFPTAIMVAHIAFPKIDPTGVPATFSKPLIRDLLINKLGYRGLIMTDDLEMRGANTIGTIGERAIRAIEAGNDMIMVAWNTRRQHAAYAAVLKAAKNGRLSMGRINESLRKIIALKVDYEINMSSKPMDKDLLAAAMGTQLSSLKEVTHRVTRENVTREVQSLKAQQIFVPPNKPITVISPVYSFYKGLKQNIPNPTKFYPVVRGQRPSIDQWLDRNPDSIGIYYATGQKTANYLESVADENKERIIVVNTTHPGFIRSSAKFKAVVNINSQDFKSGEWLSQYVANKAPEASPAEAIIRKPTAIKKSKSSKGTSMSKIKPKTAQRNSPAISVNY